MKKILIELDDRCARDLNRIAPPKKRVRAEFIRLAIRSAIDHVIDRTTANAYHEHPLGGELSAADLVGWDEHNQLAAPASSRAKKPRARRAGGKSAA
jgi:hypothetical protein